MKKKKERYFIDMDGTIAEWRANAKEADLYRNGYFYSLSPYRSILRDIRKMLKSEKEIYILSAYLTERAKADKEAWLDKYLPELPPSSRIFVPYGTDKAETVRRHFGEVIKKEDVLIDDHSPNLLSWQKAGGTGIKALNGINGSGKKWHGPSIHVRKE